VHQGQFGEAHPRCLDCHDRERFMPSTFAHEAHAAHYPLTGGHAAVPCLSCHKIDEQLKSRKFTGTTHICKDCHEYPHGEQFAAEVAKGDCTTCHSPVAETFHIRPWDHRERTGYDLVDAHAQATCNDCHVPSPETSGAFVRKFRKTEKECGTCHLDVHRGQFVKDGRDSCSSCHQSFHAWETTTFDHNTMSRFPLEGAHTRVACGRCHQNVTLPDGGEVVQYKPVGVECRDCHEIDSTSNKALAR
jgi:hypothetical protein